MAEKRMFSMKIIDSDAFLDMPMSSQALYFHLNMRADDDGFINNPKKILRIVGCTEDDLRLLITKRFLLAFESGVIVVKHWRMHNYIRKDRYHPTPYQDELRTLGLKDNGSYTDDEAQMVDRWLSDGCQVGDRRLTENSIEENRREENRKETGMPTDIRESINAIFKEAL